MFSNLSVPKVNNNNNSNNNNNNNNNNPHHTNPQSESGIKPSFKNVR